MRKISHIDIRFIPESEMRQPGIGDWWFAGDTLHIRAANTTPEVTDGEGPWSFLVALHEMVEAILCDAHGVDQSAVDAFDNAFEAGSSKDEGDEPGDDPEAPYRTEHRHAMLMEHLMANFLGITDYGTIR